MLTQRAKHQILQTAKESRGRLIRQMETLTVQLETLQGRITDLRNVMSTFDYCIEVLEEDVEGRVGSGNKE